MRERPILFSTPMVQAILNGRKTMTRRVCKIQPVWGIDHCHWSKTGWALSGEEKSCTCVPVKCPYGNVGDHLWVRETWQSNFSTHVSHNGILYKATAEKDKSWHGNWAYLKNGKWLDHYERPFKWKPSIFMPRWASRIALEITNIRVERLQEITEEDALKEGIEIAGKIKSSGTKVYKNYFLENNPFTQAKHSFHTLWDSINGKKYPWSSNPWAWVIEFEVTP